MSLREKLNKNSSFATVGSAGIILLAIVVLAWQLWPRGYPKYITQAFYTDDDGKSYYADTFNLAPPFMRNGKEVNTAIVVRCGWSKPFVAYMLRYDEKAKKAMDELVAKGGKVEELFGTYAYNRVYKRPGDAAWVTEREPGYRQLAAVQCPDGKTSPQQLVP